MPKSKTLHSPEDKIFWELLVEMRGRKRLTQDELADFLDKPQFYIRKCETGERRVDPVEWLGICEAMGVSFKDSAAELRERLGALPAKLPSS